MANAMPHTPVPKDNRMYLRAAFPIALAMVLLASAGASDWPQWRGPNRDGIAPGGPALAKAWTASGPKKVWDVHGLSEGGEGSVSVAGGACYLYIHANSTAKDLVFCYDAATGAQKWKKELPGASTLQDASSSPTVYGGKVYVAGARAAYCLDAATGDVVWKSEYSPGRDWKTDQMEVCSSFAVLGEALVLCAGRANGFDIRTGKVQWSGSDLGGNASGLASPVVWRKDGKEYAVCIGIGLACYDPYTGKEMWKLGGKGPVNYGSSPTVGGDDVVAVVDGQLCRARMSLDKAEMVWKAPFFDDFASAVIHRGHVYTVGPNKKPGSPTVTCRELGTGNIVWETPVTATEYSSPVIVDGKLLALVDKGATLVMIDADPKGKGTVLASVKVGALNWTSPSVADGKVYLRLKDGIACYDLTASANPGQ